MNQRKRRENTGNYISEWFGYRIYTPVTPAENMLANILSERCPFLSVIKDESTLCIKKENRVVTQVAEDGTDVRVRQERRTGVCTINSNVEAARRDWIACPYRILDMSIVEQAARRLFNVPPTQAIKIVAAPTLTHPAINVAVTQALAAGSAMFVLFEQKMGGEISLPATPGSPELAFDLTLAELVATNGGYDVRRYGIVELQTSDFHGSPGHAIGDLRKAADLFSDDEEGFVEELQQHPEWMSNKVEGPNISNIFKRTFYQMMFKFQLVKDGACAGCALILPLAVWESWQRHLGKPELADMGNGVFALVKPPTAAPMTKEAGAPEAPPSAPMIPVKASWIYVVAPQTNSECNPNPLAINMIVATDAPAFSYYALEKSPDIAVTTSGKLILASLRQKIQAYWPAFGLRSRSAV